MYSHLKGVAFFSRTEAVASGEWRGMKEKGLRCLVELHLSKVSSAAVVGSALLLHFIPFCRSRWSGLKVRKVRTYS